MGLFDYIAINDVRFTCSEGHSLKGMEFQSKDFGCVMGRVEIIDGGLTMHAGSFGKAPSPDYNEVEIYGDCTLCPAFVQDGTGNLIGCWVEFSVVIEGDRVISAERISTPTREWLETEPKREHMKECEGPMPYEEARSLHIQYVALRPARVLLWEERWQKRRADLDAKPGGPTKP
jgi:hypothetical protein